VKHPSEGEVEGFIHGRLEPEERRRVVLHLLAGCGRCSRTLSPFTEVLFQEEDDLADAAGGAVTDFYDAALDKAGAHARRYATRCRKESALLDRALEAARTHAPGGALLCEEVLALRGPTRLEALLRLSFEERYRNPEKMLLLAVSAKTVAELLDPAEHGAALVADLQARALAEMGNALRVNEQWDLAEEALLAADARLGEGSGDPLLTARVADVQASLCSDRRRLGEALDLLQVAHKLYRRAGDLHLAGRALISWGITTHYDGRPREAVPLLQEGLELIDSGRDPQLLAVGQQSLIHALADSGEFQEAGRLLLGSGLRQAFAAEPLSLLKLRWVEGKVLAGLGKRRLAEKALEQARDGFLARGREYDAALVGLELAALWLEQGRTAEVREVAEETVDLLWGLGVHSEAFKAASLLRAACRQRVATVGLVRRVHGFLTQVQWQPHLRFASC
jgi:tetratricopeptide (TPR) repeat protein